MYVLTKRYQEKRAFITGAGAAIGRALCEELAKDGWTLGIADVNSAVLSELTESIKTLGGKTLPYVLDVSDRNAYGLVAEEFL